MPDTTTIILLATLAQTVVITLTLLVFIFQFRSQETAIKESSYQNLMGRYNDFITSQVSNPDLNGLFVERVRKFNKQGSASPQDAAIYGNLLIAYGIIEEAFLLYDKGWIDEDTWEQWATWLRALSSQPQFSAVHEASHGMFDKGFEGYAAGLLAGKK